MTTDKTEQYLREEYPNGADALGGAMDALFAIIVMVITIVVGIVGILIWAVRKVIHR